MGVHNEVVQLTKVQNRSPTETLRPISSFFFGVVLWSGTRVVHRVPVSPLAGPGRSTGLEENGINGSLIEGTTPGQRDFGSIPGFITNSPKRVV